MSGRLVGSSWSCWSCWWRSRRRCSATTWTRCTRARRCSVTGCSARWSAASTGSRGSTPKASSAGAPTPCRCCSSAWPGVLLLYAVLRFQAHLPFNADHQKAVSPGVSFNTAISFLTNTNWQVYSGESTMSHLSQMFGLVLQQFLSAAVGMAVVVALIRGLVRRRSTHARQLLGGHHPRRSPGSCCRSRSCSPSC